MSEEFERLEKVAKEHFGNLSLLSVKIGRGKQFFSSYKNKTGIGKKILQELNNKLSVNMKYILYGEEPMILDDKDVIVEETISYPRLMHGVPFFNIDINASFLESFQDIEEEPEFFVDFKPFNDCSAYLQVYGDSMYPKYASGEIIAVKQINNFDLLQWGEAYLVITDAEANNMRTVKLIYSHKDHKKIILRASNPNFNGDMVVNKANIINLFIVKGKITRNQL